MITNVPVKIYPTILFPKKRFSEKLSMAAVLRRGAQGAPFRERRTELWAGLLVCFRPAAAPALLPGLFQSVAHMCLGVLCGYLAQAMERNEMCFELILLRALLSLMQLGNFPRLFS